MLVDSDGKLRVLLIEDDEIDQVSFRRFVEHEQLPYRCTIIGSLAEAQHFLGSQRFDVVVTDYDLGNNGTGFDVLAIAGETPVIFVTGMGSENIAVKAMKAGAYDYIVKDVQREYLKVMPIIIENTVKRKWAEIQAREVMNERLRRQVLQEFIRDASHDLRTPLTVLGTSLQLLDKQLDRLMISLGKVLPEIPPEIHQAKERSDLLQQHKNRLDQIVINMLEMVRLDVLDVLEFRPTDLNLLVWEVLEICQPNADTKNIILDFRRSEETLVFEAGGEFNAVIYHLVMNAITFTAEGGNVIVITEGTETEVILEVRDTGIGIADDEIIKIFRRFYRVDEARGMDYGGVGLGLSMVKRLLDLHKGDIQVKSMIGDGSSFRITIPRIHTSKDDILYR